MPAQVGLEARRAQIMAHDNKPPSVEALTRKKRSLTVLKAQSIPFSATLPVIDDSTEAKRRTTREVAERAIALLAVSLKAEKTPSTQVEKLIEKFGVIGALSPKERVFIDDPSPSEHDRLQFSWRYESFGTMMWALGFVDKVPPSNAPFDVTKMISLLCDIKAQGFYAKAKLRAQSEILDQDDLIYRYHWALVEAQIKKRKAPSQLNPDVVLERHQSLNWLVGYMNQSWDDVTTDT